MQDFFLSYFVNKYSHLPIYVRVHTHSLIFLYSYFINSTGDYCRCVEKKHSKIVETDSSPIHCTLQYYFLVSNYFLESNKKYALQIFEESFKSILINSKSLSPKVQTGMIWNKILPAIFVGRRFESRNWFLIDVSWKEKKTNKTPNNSPPKPTPQDLFQTVQLYQVHWMKKWLFKFHICKML